jgi:hypothetical protein
MRSGERRGNIMNQPHQAMMIKKLAIIIIIIIIITAILGTSDIIRKVLQTET